MSEIPKHDSDEYKKLCYRGKLLRELGEVIIEQYGESKSIMMLMEYKEEKEKEDDK